MGAPGLAANDWDGDRPHATHVARGFSVWL